MVRPWYNTVFGFLLLYVLPALAVAFLVALAWALLFFSGWLGTIDTVAFSVITLIVGFGYVQWVQTILESSTVRPRQFNTMLQHVENYARDFVTYNAAPDSGNVSALILPLPEMIHRMFDPSCTRRFFGNTQCDRDPVRAIRSQFMLINTQARAFSTSGALSDENVRILHDRYVAIDTTLIEISNGMQLAAPTILTKFIGVVLVIYFLFLPILLWPPYGWWMLGVYPALILLLIAPWLASKWLGDPFTNSSNVFYTTDYAQLVLRTETSIKSLFTLDTAGEVYRAMKF